VIKSLKSGVHADRLAKIKSRSPAKRIGTEDCEDLRAAIYYLASCTPYVNGQSIVVDGGFSISGGS